MKILVFGNPYLKEDNLAINVAEKLGDVEYIENTFQLVDKNLGEYILLDVVKNLDKPRFLETKDLEQGNIATAHDFDLGFFLKLMNKKVKIIGIPQEGDVNELVKEVKELVE